MYETAFSVMPSWASRFLPPPSLIGASNDVAPGEYKTLSPPELKAALIGLSSKDLLTEIPKDTINLLIFNNYTRSA